MGRLSYSMPSITDLIAGTTMDQFKPFDEIAMYSEIDDAETGTTLTCANEENCAVRYSWSYTPKWYYVSPSVVYPGCKLNLYVNPMYAPNYKAATDLPIHIKLDGTRLDISEYTDQDTTLDTD